MANDENNGAEPERMVKLVSLDDCSFELPVKAAILSNLVKDMGDSGDNDNSNNDDDDGDGAIEFREPIDLVRVRGEVLEKVVDFLKHYHQEPMLEIQVPLQGNSLSHKKRETYSHETSTNITLSL